MTQDTCVVPRHLADGDQVRQHQQILLQSHLQQQLQQQQFQHQQFQQQPQLQQQQLQQQQLQQQQLQQQQFQQQQLQQHQLEQQQYQQQLQRQQLMQHQLQQQFHHQQWSPQINAPLCSSYSYPVPTADFHPLLPTTVGSYPQVTVRAAPAAPAAPPAELGAAAAAPTGPPPLSLRDTLHILGESVAVLECLRLLLLQLLQWGGEVGALLQASTFLRYLVRFLGTSGASASRYFRRGLSALFLSFTSLASRKEQQQQPWQRHQQGGGQELQTSQRDSLLQDAWQLAISSLRGTLSNEGGEGDATQQRRRKGAQKHRVGSLSLLSKAAAAAGTLVAASSTATRRGGSLLKVLSGKIGGFLYCALFLGILYRIYLQWRKYRRLLKRYRRLAARMSAREANRVEDVEEAATRVAVEVHSGTKERPEEENAASFPPETCRTTADNSTLTATTAAATGAESNLSVDKDARGQDPQPLDTPWASTSLEVPSASARAATNSAATAAEQHRQRARENAAGWSPVVPTPAAVAPWTPAAATPPYFPLTATPTVSASIDQRYTLEKAKCTRPALPTKEPTVEGSMSMTAAATLLPAAFHEIQPHEVSHLPLTNKSAAAVGATMRLSPATHTQVAEERPSKTPCGVATGPPHSRTDADMATVSLTNLPPTTVSETEAAVSATADSAAKPPVEAASKGRGPAKNSGESLLHQFLHARLQQVKDPAKAALWAVSLEKLRAATTAGPAALEGALTGKSAAGDTMSAAKERRFSVAEPLAAGEAAALVRGDTTKADSEAPSHAVVASSDTSADKFRQRAASWSDGVQMHASLGSIEAASRKAAAALVAAEVTGRSACQAYQGDKAIGPALSQLDPPTSTSSGTSATAVAALDASNTAGTLLFPLSSVLGLNSKHHLHYRVEANAKTSRAATPGSAPAYAMVNSSGSPPSVVSFPASYMVTAANTASCQTNSVPAAKCTRGRPDSANATAAAEVNATCSTQKKVDDYVEEQLRCFKASERRKTPAFNGNPFLGLCSLQQHREQQKKQQQHLLEHEFSRTDIPPWERGSRVEDKNGEHEPYTSYWKDAFFPRAKPSSDAPSWALPPSVSQHSATACCLDAFSPNAGVPYISKETSLQQPHAEQTRLQQLTEPRTKDGVTQRQEDWLPMRGALTSSAASINSRRMSAVLRRPTVASLEPPLIRQQPLKIPIEANQAALSSQAPNTPHPLTPSGRVNAPLSIGVSVAVSGEMSAPCHGTNMSPARRRWSDTLVTKSNRIKPGASRDPHLARIAASADAEAAAGPAAAIEAATKPAATVKAPRVMSVSKRLATGDTPLATTKRRGSMDCDLKRSTVCHGPAKESGEFVLHEKRRGLPCGADGAAGPHGDGYVSLVPSTAATARRASVGTGRSHGSLSKREIYLAETASAVRQRQETKLRQLLRVQPFHQQPREQRQQPTQQQVRHHSQQHDRMGSSTNGTPSTASDADCLAEPAAAPATDEAAESRYFFPEIYV